jgi:hypothetical protein
VTGKGSFSFAFYELCNPKSLCVVVEFVEMELQESITEIFEKFTWKIHNFSRLNADKMYSEPFVINGYPWYAI